MSSTKKKMKFFNFKHIIQDIFKVVIFLPFYILYRPKYFYDKKTNIGRKIKNNYIICANHGRSMDPFLMTLIFMKRRLNILTGEKVYLRGRRLGSWWLDRIGCIRVSSKAADIDSFNKVLRRLEEKKVVVVYPEGYVKRNGEVDSFRAGAILMAIKSKTPILPVYLAKRKSIFNRLKVMIGTPLFLHHLGDSNNLNVNDLEKLASLLRDKVLELKDSLINKEYNKKIKTIKGASKMQRRQLEFYEKLMIKEELPLLKDLDTMSDFLNFIAAYDKKIAVESEGLKKTYEELLSDCAKTRGFLEANGFKKGDHIGIQLLNDYDFIRIFLAITSFGAVAVLIPYQLTPEKVKGISLMTDLGALITNKNLETALKNVLSIRVFDKDNTFGEPVDVCKSLNKDELALIMFTGGTTKMPKGVMLTSKNLLHGVKNGAYLNATAFGHRYLNLMPFTHIFGLARSALTPLYTGSYLYTCVDPKNMIKDLLVAKPDMLVLVPGLADLLYGLIKLKGKENIVPDLRVIISGGAHVHPNLILKFREIGVTLFQGYGSTESAGLVSGNVLQLENNKLSAVGVPYPGQEAKIVDGTLWLRGENIMMGYYKNEAQTRAVLVDGWFNTSDLATIDDKGLIYIVGRNDNLIVLSNGENVSPEELESYVLNIPYVKDCLVYGDDKKDLLVVEVFPNKAVIDALKIGDLKEALLSEIAKINKNLPSYMHLSKVVIRDEDFKRSPAMKIIRG